jgi:hypothetical protein
MATVLAVTTVLLLAFWEIIGFKEGVVNIWAGVLIFTSQKRQTVSNNRTYGWTMIPMFVQW